MKQFLIFALMALPFIAPAHERPRQPIDQPVMTPVSVMSVDQHTIAGDTGTQILRDDAILANTNRGRTNLRIAFFHQRTAISAPTTSNSGLLVRNVNLPQPFS